MAVGMAVEMSAGRKSEPMSACEVTLPRIQSMMVVTSPMGDHVPPLLAAMTMMLAKSQRSLRLAMMRRSSITMMMVVVMLSSTADMKKVMMASSQSSLCLLWVVMWSVMTPKPPWESMRSTMVMAPMR